MGDRGTFKSGDSMSSHSKDSMDIINRIVTLSISCMRDLVNPHEGVFVDMTFNKFMRSLEHIRETIEEWEVMCNELDEDNSELRKTIEILAGNCPYRNEYCDASDCAGCKYARINILARQMREIQELTKDRDRFRDLAISRNKELGEEREKSNQLEKECSSWEERCTELKEELSWVRKQHGGLIERCAKLVRDRDNTVDYWTKHCENLFHEHRKCLAAKDREIYELKSKLNSVYGYVDTDIAHMYPKTLINNPANFCGNCKYFEMSTHSVGVCVRLKKQNNFKAVDPDDASCPCFQSNQTDRVVIGKPEFPCCEHCSHEDCDNCTLCPF